MKTTRKLLGKRKRLFDSVTMDVVHEAFVSCAITKISDTRVCANRACSEEHAGVSLNEAIVECYAELVGYSSARDVMRGIAHSGVVPYGHPIRHEMIPSLFPTLPRISSA